MELIQNIDKEQEFLVNTVKKTLHFSKNKSLLTEVFITKTIGIGVNVRNQNIEYIEFNSDGALCITVYNKFSKGSVSSKDFSSDGIKKMLDIAVNISKYTSSDFFSGLPDINVLCFNPLDLDLFHPWEFNVNNGIEFAKEIENEAFKFDERIINSEGSSFHSHITINIFGNSLNMLSSYKSTLHSVYNCMIAKDNHSMERDCYYDVSRNIEDLEKSDIIGQKTAKRAVSRLGSRKIKTMKTSVVFSSEISYILFSHLINAISGNNVYQKSTFLINDLQKKIFPNWMNIKENPHIKKGLGSKPFDSEGVSTYSKYIIKDGILQTWLLNSYNARRLKLTTTANSGGIYNWLISHKNVTFKELLKEVNNGVLITELMGQGVDIVSGNYSRGAVGFWIKNGNIEYPVNEITISGNLRNMWKNIVSISNDINIRHKIQCGSVLLSEMQISGS